MSYFFSVSFQIKIVPYFVSLWFIDFILVKFYVLYIHNRIEETFFPSGKLDIMTTWRDCSQMVKIFACCL